MKIEKKNPVKYFEKKLFEQKQQVFTMQELKDLFDTKRRYVKKYLDVLIEQNKVKKYFDGKRTIYEKNPNYKRFS